MKLLGTMEVSQGVLSIGGVKTTDIVNEFKTPVYVMDEQLIRNNCKSYINAFKVNELGNKVAFAGKAFLTIAMCQLVKEEGLCLDVVSGGELFTASKAGFPLENVYFHGNNKTIEEIDLGISLGVGRFVADNYYEIDKINEIAKSYNKVQKILLRITPGIEAHTHDYIKTGQIDSKFGFTLLNNNTMDAVKKALSLSNIELVGLHCHIGSQIFDIPPYEDAVEIMLGIMKDIYTETKHEFAELDLGGGFGIYYTKEDNPKSEEAFCSAIINKAEVVAKELGMKLPKLVIEPGRSIVGNAGTTLYTVGAIKQIPDIRKYIAVDGGMTDNIRPALYRAEYENAIVNKMNVNETEVVTVAGKCCESGDILLNDVVLPKAESGDILGIFSTGAYGYSMSSNYNKIPKPPVVFVKDGKTKLVCRRESFEDLVKNELELNK